MTSHEETAPAAEAASGDQVVAPGVYSNEDAAQFCIELAKALVSYGLPSNRIEDALERISTAWGVEASFVSTPTSIMLTVGSGATARTQIARLHPSGSDLGRLSSLYELVGQVERREITPRDGVAAIEAIVAAPERWPAYTVIPSYALSAFGASCLLDGELNDVVLATILGLAVGTLSWFVTKRPLMAQLMPALAAALCSTTAYIVSHEHVHVRPLMVTLAALAVFLPGLMMTSAMIELATGNWVSGAARLFGAGATLFLMVLGVVFGQSVAEHVPRVAMTHLRAEKLPPLFASIAPILLGVSFSVLLRARRRDFPLILAAGYVATGGAWIGAELLGRGIGGFVGAWLAAMVSHLYSRWMDRPASVVLVPAILMLVPGSMGFLSLTSLLQDEVDDAIQMAFKMTMVAASLAAGVLVATMMLPPRRSF